MLFSLHKLVVGDRLKEPRAYAQLAAQGARLTVTFCISNGHKAHNQVRSAGDYNLFTLASFFDQLGKIGFGFMNSESLH